MNFLTLNDMKRILVIWLICLCSLSVMAQTGLSINSVFEGKVVGKEMMKMSFIKGDNLSDYDLDVLRTTKFVATPEERDRVEALYLHDIQQYAQGPRENREEGYAEGRLSYAVVQLSDRSRNVHRYLCYQCRDAGEGKVTITLAYMEGKASMKQLRKMFKRK